MDNLFMGKVSDEKKYMESNNSELPLEWYDEKDVQSYIRFNGFKLIESIDFTGKLVLDLGAYSGWLGRQVYKRKGNVILLDIFDISFRNLVRQMNGKQDNFMIGMIGNKEKLYFIDDTFDYIVTANVLHHGNLEETVKEIYRVLKHGGQFISIQEPMIPVSYDENEYLASDPPCVKEIAGGCDERRPNLLKYRTAFDNTFGNAKILIQNDLTNAYEEFHGGIVIHAKKI